LRQGCPEQQSGQLFQEPGEYHSPTKPAYPADENWRRDSQASTVHQVQARGPGGREGGQTGRSSSDMRVEQLVFATVRLTDFIWTREEVGERFPWAAEVDGEVVAVSVPLKVCPELLDGDLAGETGLEKIRGFFMMGDARW